MKVTHVLKVSLFAVILVGGASRARAQIKGIDDVLAITKGQAKKEQVRTHQHLAIPGGESPFGYTPGSGAARLGEPGLAPVPGILSSAAAGPGQPYPGVQRPEIAPAPRAFPVQKIPLYGPLELPDQEDEGPPDGVTLDAAIDRLVNANFDLRTKFQEIPKAEADILSAGLRLNPLVFASADNVPYGSYSEERPGANSYAVTVAQPIDWNQKRQVRVEVAQRAKRTLEAQYQDAVRLQIDNLYSAYVDVLDARQTVRALKASLEGFAELVKTTAKLVEAKQLPKTDLDRLVIQQYNAEVAFQAAETTSQQAKRNLATLLALPPDQASFLDVRGSVRDSAQGFPVVAELIHIALEARPDLAAYRLGVQRAEASIQLARAERFEEVFLFYTPYNFTNNAPLNKQSATSWGLGVLLPLPVYNRNQGNIARAQYNASQTQIELAGQERQVINEVQRAIADYASSRKAVDRYENDIVPAAKRLREANLRLYQQRQVALAALLESQREYNDVVRQYLETLVRHRRNMLRLNTAVGQRIMP